MNERDFFRVTMRSLRRFKMLVYISYSLSLLRTRHGSVQFPLNCRTALHLFKVTRVIQTHSLRPGKRHFQVQNQGATILNQIAVSLEDGL